MLDEIAASGYLGTELGDWGFFPTAPSALAAEIGRRGLALVGAFVPIAFSRGEAVDEGIERAVRTAALMAQVPDNAAVPVVVLSDDNATVPERTARAGRIRDEDGLSAAQWDQYAARVERVASAVRDASGLRCVFHHHCAGFVETPHEIDALMSRTSPALVGLCLDTGHLTYAGGDPVGAIACYGDRIWHVHFKDCEPEVARTAREHRWDYHAAVRHGIFCELGRGAVLFAAVRDALRSSSYEGWIVVEQDVLPGLGTPAASARRNREYLRRLGF